VFVEFFVEFVVYFGCAFAGQATHADAATRPGSAEYVPASQSRQVAASVAPTVAECLPAAQSTQTLALAPPVLVAYLPAAQLTQEKLSEAPVSGENLPAPQSRHVPASDAPTVAEYLPAPHATHALSAVAPVLIRYLPAPQSVHSALPTVDLNLPTGHKTHDPPFKKAPAAHDRRAAGATQFDSAVLPAGEVWPSGHAVQLHRPVIAPYVFGPHIVHPLKPATE
jgi:hypothetical protein